MQLKLEKFHRNSQREVELVLLWWKEKTGADIGQDTMSDFGYMVYDDMRPVAALFLYPVIGCQMAMIGFPIANPLVFRDERREALDFLVASVEKEAKKLHYDYLLSYAGSSGAKELFGRVGYKIADQEVTNFIKRI